MELNSLSTETEHLKSSIKIEIPFWKTLQEKAWFFTLKQESQLMVHDSSNIVCKKLIVIISGN